MTHANDKNTTPADSNAGFPDGSTGFPEWPEDPASPKVQVLYFQQECLVVNKPGGLLTQAPAGITSVESQARRFFRQVSRQSWPASKTTGNPDEDYVGVPHRLDRATSGALLLGQSKQVTRKLAAQFERRTIRKFYWVLVQGSVNEPRGTWGDWMRKLPEHSLAEITTESEPLAQWAELEYQVLGSDRGISLLNIHLKTGRTHQIRLQAASRGLPIVGDSWYGSTTAFGTWFDDERRRSIALHAKMLDFWHPRRQHAITVNAPVPEAWSEFAATNSPQILPLLDPENLL